MMRVASQLIFCSPDDIRRRTVIELDAQQTVTHLFSLDESPVESAQTLFYDGILSAEIISVKENGAHSENLVAHYNYVDLSSGISTEISRTEKQLILDFGTSSPEKINKHIAELTGILPAFSTFEIIAACCYFPALALGKTAALSTNRKATLLLWENTDLVNKKLTGQTRIRKIS